MFELRARILANFKSSIETIHSCKEHERRYSPPLNEYVTKLLKDRVKESGSKKLGDEKVAKGHKLKQEFKKMSSEQTECVKEFNSVFTKEKLT